MPTQAPRQGNISIHSPRMGSDDMDALREHVRADFNPLSPHGERHPIDKGCTFEECISIHSPRMGRDVFDGAPYYDGQ